MPLSLYPFLTFAGSFLLFLVQPIAGRMVLPVFGGTPSVWITCLLFFQLTLLAGYACAHFLPSRWIRLLLPVLVAIQFWGSSAPAASSRPVVAILGYLALTVGPVSLGLSMLSPLLQRWYRDRTGEEPYRLYAFSNAGSLLALFAYPLAIEPFLKLTPQYSYWMIAAALVFVAILRATPVDAPAEVNVMPPARDLAFWAALSACGSALLSATTNQMTQEIPPTPFLWVLPLAVFLVSFILTFESNRWYNARLFGTLSVIAVMFACMAITLSVNVPIWASTLIYTLALFAGCMVCFGELVKSRPPAESLTAFYLAIAAGGALGSFLIAVVSPLLFKQMKTEFLVALILCLGVPFLGWSQEKHLGLARFAPPALAIAAVFSVMFKDDDVGVQRRSRNFFGAVQVHLARNPDDNLGIRRVLTHGIIVHGTQYIEKEKRMWATTYYGTGSGVGLMLSRLPKNARVAAVGLGIGTIAVHGRAEDVYRFYEINPDIADIAMNDFTYLRNSAPRVEIVLGDARLKLAEEQEPFDAIIVDAFSSDSIPAHLLTAEAGKIYLRLLKPNGALMFHLSNRALDLIPVAQGLARHLGLQSMTFFRAGDKTKGGEASNWILLTRNKQWLGDAELRKLTTPGSARPSILWTDDYSSLLPLLKWWPN